VDKRPKRDTRKVASLLFITDLLILIIIIVCEPAVHDIIASPFLQNPENLTISLQMGSVKRFGVAENKLLNLT
jgi:hypothetical protein